MKKIILLFVSLFFIASASNIKIDSLDVGGRTVKVPEPVGLKEISHIESLKALVAKTGGSLNKVLAAYYSVDYADSFPNTKTVYPDMWATFLVSKKIENYYVTLKNYKDTVAYIKSNNDNIFKEIAKRLDDESSMFNKGLKKDYGMDFNLTLNVPKLIPNESYEEDSYFGYVYLLKLDEKTTAVGSTVMLHIHQRMLTLNIYKEYHSEDDIDSLIKESKIWLNDIVKLNNKENKQACEHGNIADCYNLGIITARGEDGVKQDDVKAVEFFKKACDGDYAKGCHELGKIYYAGRGVQQDNEKALKLFNKACDGGSIRACFNLGVSYGTGIAGVKQDYSLASKFYHKACDGGDANASFNLGVWYANGIGLKQDYVKAIALYEKACDGNYFFACTNLGNMYSTARGVKQDYLKSAKLHRKACDNGNAQGCFNLGVQYYKGQGVEYSKEKAKELVHKACYGGYTKGCVAYKSLK